MGFQHLYPEKVKLQREAMFNHYKERGFHLNDLELELACFRNLPFGHPLKGEYCISLSRMRWDFLYIEKDGIENYWFTRICRALCKYRRVYLVGSASSGKTFSCSAVGMNLWGASPWDSTFIVTSTDKESLDSKAWGTIRDLHDKDKLKIGVRVDYEDAIVLEKNAKQRDIRDAIKAIALPKGSEGEKSIGKVQGRKNQNIIWLAQPLNSKVLTPSGWNTIGELKEGDEIVSSSGGVERVTKTHPVHTNLIYELTFSDGSKARSSLDHLWTFKTKRGVLKTAPLGFFKNTLRNKALVAKKFPVFRWELPESPVVEYRQEKPFMLSPYILGALIGDGSILKNASLYCFVQDLEIAERVERELPQYHRLPFIRQKDNCNQYHVAAPHKRNVILNELRRIGLFGKHGNHKFIPKEYLHSSFDSRVALLQGLMDTDGSATGSTLRYSTNSPQLSKDVVELVRSLGGYADECIGERISGVRYTVVISLPSLRGVMPFHCARKRNRCSGYGRNTGRHRRLISVEEVGIGEMRCITTSAPDGLYITDDHVLTHNCDEYAHMDPFVQKARANLASAPSFLFWACSNKPEEGDAAYVDAAPDPLQYPLGWETPGLSDMEMWPTKGGGITLYFNGEKSPNTLATGDKDPFPMLTRRDYIAAIRDEEGIESYGYDKYIRAFPRAGESHDKVINSKMLERYGALEDPVWSGTGWITVAGFDPAWTKGGDDAMADFARVGNSFEGIKIMAHEPDAVKLRASATSGKTFEEQIAEAFIAECKKRECHVVAIDISGGGGRVAMAVRDAATIANWRLEIISVDAAGSPSEEMYEMGDVQKSGKEAFDRRVSELLISYRLSIQQRLVKGVKMDSRAIRELCDRRASNDEKKRYTVEKKADYKKRNNGKSPDAGESRILAHVAARAHGLGAGRVTVKKSIQKQIAEALKPQSDRQSAYGWSGSAKPKAYSW